jgi:DNA repair exonuclease SbcCD ATPase subunit
MDFQHELKAVEQEIKTLENREEYKTLAKKNRAWAVLKPTEEEKGEWGLLKEKLAKLEKHKEFYQKAILSTNSHSLKKADSTHKKYKKDTAIKMRDCCCQMWRSRCGSDLGSL